VTKRIDWRTEDKSPARALNNIRPSAAVRVYESSYGGLSVVLLTTSFGGLDAAARISREDALNLFHALGAYLVATGDDE
jgi:hypothetical protein